MRVQEITLVGFACVASTNAIFLGYLNYTRPDPPANYAGYVRPWSFARSGRFSADHAEHAAKSLESLFPGNGFFKNSSADDSSSSSISHSHSGSDLTGLDCDGLKSDCRNSATGDSPEESKNRFKPNAIGFFSEGGFLDHLGDTFMPNASTSPLNVSKTVKSSIERLQVDLSEALIGFDEIAKFTESPSRTFEPLSELLSFVTPFLPQKEDFEGPHVPENSPAPKEDESFGDFSTLTVSSMPPQEENPAASEINESISSMPTPEPSSEPVYAKREAEKDVKPSQFHANAARSDHARDYDGEAATCGYKDVGVKPREISEKTEEELAAEKSRVEESSKYLPNRI